MISSQSQLAHTATAAATSAAAAARGRRDRLLLAAVTMTTVLLWTSYYHRYFDMMQEQHHVGEQNNKIRSRLLRSTERTLRFLTFGSTSTWGQGLRNRQREAFPYLLSSEVDNYATSFGGAALPAVCTQSIVGDEAKYDVIVLEYSPDQIDDGLSVLAKRLRQRYPNATMVFVRLWSPSRNLWYQLNESHQISADEWRRQSGTSLFRGRRPQKEALSTDPNMWSLEMTDATQLRELVSSVNGHLYSLPSPQPDRAIETLTNYIDLFQNEDWSQLSPLGHSLVAHGILNIVQRYLPPSLEQQTLGTWGSGDACALWQSTGILSSSSPPLSSSPPSSSSSLLSSSLSLLSKTTATTTTTTTNKKHRTLLSTPQSSTTRRVHFGGYRHAVEIGSGAATFVVNNPFGEERMLYLTYMTALAPSLSSSSSSAPTSSSATTSTSPSSKVYPATRISIGDKPSVIINPVYTAFIQDQKQSEHIAQQQKQQQQQQQQQQHYPLPDPNQHRARTTPIGVIPPGETIIKLEAQEKTLNRFRLTGASFLGSLQVPIEFALEPDVVYEQSDGLQRFFTV